MSRYRALLVTTVALLAAAVGSGWARADGGCAPTNAVFYSGDTVNLATALHANASACTDYWISITPTTGGTTPGEPRGGAPLTTIHGFGSHFHALAELRPEQWTAYAAANGWYAAGVKLHDDMLTAGYDPARDTWAVNEVGSPSGSANATDVFLGNDGARQSFEDFVRGLYTGSNGAVMPGLVFAADPAQYTTDIWQYEQGLARWYADAPFWQDMQQHVRFWAQETYADARSWGVADASLDERAAYLNDYFGHGLRLAGSGGAAAAAARSFFATAYTPLGNATYRWPAPDPATGLGFGLTDIPIDAMLDFVSAQTYALRISTPTQLGFAISAKNSTATLNGQIYARLAATIHDSDGDPSGACTTGCDGTVDGAAFTDAWRNFATGPVVVPHVEGVQGTNGWYTSDVTVSWAVSDPQTAISSTTGCDTQTIAADTAGTQIACTAVSSGGTTTSSVTIARDATPPLVTCTPSPATIWPPNNQLVPVDVDVTVTDAMSRPAGWELTDAPADFVDFGALRAIKDSEYDLAYTARDLAGNVATCDAIVVVPHDARHLNPRTSDG